MKKVERQPGIKKRFGCFKLQAVFCHLSGLPDLVPWRTAYIRRVAIAELRQPSATGLSDILPITSAARVLVILEQFPA